MLDINIIGDDSILDMAKKVFGDLTVLRYDQKGKWICFCSCNPEKELSIAGTTLRNGSKTHCGCKRIYRHKDEIVFPKEYKNKFKICIDCGLEKPYEDFYFQEKIDKDGNITYYFYTMCIECNKERAYQRILDNMDEHRELIRRNNQRPNIIQIKRDFSKKQKESGYYSEYQKNNPDKIKEYNLNRQHKNHDITNTEWNACKQYFNNECAYCGLPLSEHYRTYAGEPLKEDLHKEHVIFNGENDLSNCVPSCRSCNEQKWEFGLDDWYSENNSNYTQERYDKIIKWITEDFNKYIVK